MLNEIMYLCVSAQLYNFGSSAVSISTNLLVLVVLNFSFGMPPNWRWFIMGRCMGLCGKSPFGRPYSVHGLMVYCSAWGS